MAMSVKQILISGTFILAGSTVYDLLHGTDVERAGAAFGGSFSMMVTLAVLAWLDAKHG